MKRAIERQRKNNSMPHKNRVLTSKNIERSLREYTASIEQVGGSIRGLRGRTLLESIKRDKVMIGPYPKVTLFEAANRIMTDLVIYHGVKWLFENKVFPFSSYIVEFGNEDTNGFDIRARNGKSSLIGEAFNVAPSFFQHKKAAMLKKLRSATSKAEYRVIMVNHDAVSAHYSPSVRKGEYYVFVNIGKSSATIVPDHQTR